MKKSILLLIVILNSFFVFADPYDMVTKEEAIQISTFLKTHTDLVFLCGCCDDDKPEYIKILETDYQLTRWGDGSYEVIIKGLNVNGDTVNTNVSLNYTHIVREGMVYCLGLELGFDVDPCIEPFKFNIPAIKEKPRQIDLQELNYTVEPREIAAVNYDWSHVPEKPDMTWNGIESWTTALAFTKDNRYIIVGGGYFDSKTELKRIDINTGEVVHEYTGHVEQVEKIAISKNGEFMVSVGQTGKVIVWSLVTDNILFEYDSAHSDWIEGVCFSPNNYYCATASRDNYIKVWDVITGKLVRKFWCSMGGAASIAFSADNRQLIVGGWGVKNDIYIYDLSTGKVIKKLDFHPRESISIDVSPDGKYFASAGSDDNRALVVSCETKEIYQEVKSPYGAVVNVSFDPSGRFLAVAAMWGVFVWDIENESYVLQSKPNEYPNEVVAFSNDGQYLACGGRDAKIFLWKLNRDQIPETESAVDEQVAEDEPSVQKEVAKYHYKSEFDYTIDEIKKNWVPQLLIAFLISALVNVILLFVLIRKRKSFFKK